MRKCAIYCTVCVLIGIFFLLKSDNTDMAEEYADPIQQETVVLDSIEEVKIQHMDDVLFVLQDLEEASDVQINYTHSIVVGEVSYDMDYVGSTYNYDVDRGHTCVITEDYYADLWYSETDHIMHTDRLFDLDDIRTRSQNYYGSNLATIRLICQMLMSSEVQQVQEYATYTVYKATSSKQFADNNLLPVTVDSDVVMSSWLLLVPNNPLDVYTASLTIYPDANAAGISSETFYYEFRMNTGFRCTFPT